MSRERQSACHNGLLQRPWDLWAVWRKGGCSYLLSVVNGQIGDRELPRACDEALRLQTGQVVVRSTRLVKRSVPGLDVRRKGGKGRGPGEGFKKDASKEKTNGRWKRLGGRSGLMPLLPSHVSATRDSETIPSSSSPSPSQPCRTQTCSTRS